MSAEQWPLDIARLTKGDYIPPEKCEEILGVDRNRKDYSLALLGLCETIRREADKSGRQLPCRCLKDGIEIMADATAAEYYKKQFESGIKQCCRAHRRQIKTVDRSVLTEESQRGYDRAIALQSLIISSNRSIIRKFSQKQLPKK